MNLQRFFMKLQKNLNDEIFFHESPVITMRTLLNEMQNHIDLITDVEEKKKVEKEQQDPNSRQRRNTT